MSFDEPFPKGNRPDEQDWKSDEDVYDELRRLFHAGEKGDAVGRAGAAGGDNGAAAGEEEEALHGGGAMTGSELLPCPHCGGTAHMSASSDGYGVQCWDRCCIDMQMDQVETEEEAVRLWNRRAAVTDEQFAWAVHDGRTWVCVERALGSDELKPIEGFTRDSIYRDSMQEYGEWMGKATDLMRDMRAQLLNAYDPKELDGFDERLREFGIGVEPWATAATTG